MSFVHLHVHTQYSILDGLSDIRTLFERARELGMPALAITDHGNMYGVKEFFKWANDKSNKDADGNFLVKPLIGCEIYLTRHYDHHLKDSDHKKYYHLILLAKNINGYRNLIKIVSEAHTQGMYYRPRISHEILEKYHEDLICCSACLAGEIPQAIIAGDRESAVKAARWYRDLFGEDFYLEVMLHRSELKDLPPEAREKVNEVFQSQQIANDEIFRIGQELGIKVVATNDVHFVNAEDGPVHDRLICLTTNSYVDDPDRLRYTQQEFLKSGEEMLSLFPEHPEVISNTLEINDKIEAFQIDRDHVLPKYNIDEAFLKEKEKYLEEYNDIIAEGKCTTDEFRLSVAYLCHLTYQGAKIRYGETLTEEQSTRIDFELKTICKMGFPDYFLIVQDYIRAMRAQGWMVGPGRGSAAGSVVAYCLWITNLDPIKYQLLFERFLNPDRISMPDIDVDFENLTAAHEYVEKTYGADHVSRVITFGTMAAKSAIKDVARISHVSIDESNRLTKLIPDRLSEKVEKTYPFNPKLDELKPGFKSFEQDGKMFQKGMEEEDVKINLKNCYRLVPELRNELENGSELNKEVLFYAKKLEGCIRQVGQHACATIIGRGNLTDYIPICLSKDKESGEDVWTSQFDGHYIEEVGMLKMDFLGLNTLSIIHETLRLVKQNHNRDIDIEAIPIDDPETYKLYGRGDTTIVFQFESPGMKKWLQMLKPSRFEDLIAMNALYRPGPMDYIPDFVNRKLGIQEIKYDLPEMEEFLDSTYGVTVYQEQVMQLSQKLAGFTKGEADKLRKAMGKKQIEILNSLKDKFMSGGEKNGHPEKTLDKIWKDWEKFAQYAFNKSHATCYAWVSYQTAWLKCHYPAEFFAANLSCNLNNMEEIKKIMEDCRLHSIKVLSPDVNESNLSFAAVGGNIRFGLGGIKGFGANVSAAIIDEREKNGTYKDVWDFVERVQLANRKSLESLAFAGAFDSFGCHRSQFFTPNKDGNLFLDDLAHYADLFHNDTMDAGASLFGEVEELKPSRPEMPPYSGEENILHFLQKEKEIVGMYLSSHPLDRYRFEIDNFTDTVLASLPELENKCMGENRSRNANVAGIISSITPVTTKTGAQGARISIEDYSGTYEMGLYGKEYETWMPFLKQGSEMLIEGEIRSRYRLKPEEIKEGKTVRYEFKISRLSLLGSVCEQKLSCLTAIVDTGLINPEFRKNLVKLLKEFSGKVPLNVCLRDKQTGYIIDFLSKKFNVCVCSGLLEGLTELGISCKANKK